MLGYKELNGFNGLTRKGDHLSDFEATPVPVLVNCPKCGFQQPSDQYCAQCGVDMLKLRKSPAAMLTAALGKPASLAVVAIAAVLLTIGGVRTLRSKSTPPASQELANVQETRTRPNEKNRAGFASADNGDTASDVDEAPAAAVMAEPATSETPIVGSDPQNPSSTSSQVAVDDAARPAVAQTTAPTAPVGAAKTASEPHVLQVTFAWAEASREWLQAMAATTPGPHRVTDLDTKLRQSVGGYRVLDVSRQKLSDKSGATTLTHGEGLSVRFDTTTATDSSLVGSLQPVMRAADGSVRSPAATTLNIEKGQGSIVTLGMTSGTLPGGAPNTAEIVLLILPRWGANRNP